MSIRTRHREKTELFQVSSLQNLELVELVVKFSVRIMIYHVLAVNIARHRTLNTVIKDE